MVIKTKINKVVISHVMNNKTRSCPNSFQQLALISDNFETVNPQRSYQDKEKQIKHVWLKRWCSPCFFVLRFLKNVIFENN